MRWSCSCVDGSALIQKQRHTTSKLRTYTFKPEDLDGKAALTICVFAFRSGERKLMMLTQLKYVIHLVLF